MLDHLRKICMAGVAQLSEFKDDKKDYLDKYAEKGEKIDTPEARFVKASFDLLEDWDKGLRKKADEFRDKTLDALNISKQSDVETLKNKVDHLSKGKKDHPHEG